MITILELLIISKPIFIITLFSSIKGTMSAAVPNEIKSKYLFAILISLPNFLIIACINLNATAPPQRPLNGYLQSF